MKLDLEQIRDALLDEARCIDLARASVHIASQEAPSNVSEEAWSQTRDHAEFVACENIRRVFVHAESELEKLFLNTFVICAVHTAPFDFIFTPPFKNTAEAVAAFRDTSKAVAEIHNDFIRRFPGEDFLRVLDQMEGDEGFTHAEIMTIKTHHLLYHKMGRSKSVHLTPQAGFADIKVQERSIRPDLYAWIPAYPDFQVVVECDGFQFHADKESFMRDRIRDRLLQARRFRVYRFSGTEIYRDPVAAAGELLNLLLESRPKGAI